MSLQESIERRRATEPQVVACVSPSAEAPALVLSIWQGKSWVLPWSHLASAQLIVAKDNEQIVFSFTHHQVTVSGHNLGSIWEDVAALRIGRLRDLPPQYRSKAASNAPFITRIEVQCLGGSTTDKISESS